MAAGIPTIVRLNLNDLMVSETSRAGKDENVNMPLAEVERSLMY